MKKKTICFQIQFARKPITLFPKSMEITKVIGALSNIREVNQIFPQDIITVFLVSMLSPNRRNI